MTDRPRFSTAMQLDALLLAIRHAPLAGKGMRDSESELHMQILSDLADRLRRALAREQSAKMERGQ